MHLPLKGRAAALPDFSQLLVDFLNVVESRLVFTLLYDSLNLVISGVQLRSIEGHSSVEMKVRVLQCSSWTVLHARCSTVLSYSRT